jgi:TRAP-type C4-dicarboxylate transport system substrate-binding protein
MKKLFWVVLAIVLVSGLILSGCASPAPAVTPSPAPAPAPTPEAIKLVVGTWESPEGTNAQTLREWLKEVGDKSGGRISSEIAWGGAMGKAPEHYNLAVTGIADITFVAFAFTPGLFPMAEVIQLPVTGEASNEMMAEAFWELYKKGYFDEELKDVKLLWVGTTGIYDYQMGRTEVLTFDDMKGKKIRASGAIHTEIVEALGSVPVGMAAPEIYSAVEKGVIDGSFTPWNFIKSFRTETVTKSVTEIGVGSFNLGFVMNKATYNKLPSDIQAYIDDIAPKYNSITGKRHTQFDEDAKELLRAAGGAIYHLSADDTEKVGKAIAPIWEKWIAEGEGMGLSRKQLADDFYHILEEMGVQKPFHGYTP